MPSQYWKAAPHWHGLPVVIVAGGESVTLADIRRIGMARAADKIRVIAVNDAVYPCWFADIAYACDARWWHHHGALPGFAGLKISLVDDRLPAGVMLMRNAGEAGLHIDPGTIYTGRNGGFQAMQIAYHMGAAAMILVGFDGVGRHWFGDHPADVSQHATQPKMAFRIRFFAHLAPLLKKAGIRVVNVSPKTVLEMFERGDLETELNRQRKT